MSSRHSSFLVRCWNHDNDSERIEIEHIQSGTKVLVRSATAAIDWICAQSAGAVQQNPARDHLESDLEDVGKGGRDG